MKSNEVKHHVWLWDQARYPNSIALKSLKGNLEVTMTKVLTLLWAMVITYQNGFLKLEEESDNVQVANVLEHHEDKTVLDNILLDCKIFVAYFNSFSLR